MATSAIGPGFLTQTALFTSQLGAGFGFAILASIVLDIGAQLNIWRVITVSELRAQEIGNRVLPGLGTTISLLVALGGLVFNIGNIAGCGLGMNVLFGVSVPLGAVLSAIIAIGLFLVREAGRAMDRFAQSLGFLMIALTLFVAATAQPPLADAITHTFAPGRIPVVPIMTLVGGTVGGYITFAGAHRLLDAGVRGPAALPQASRAATTGILLTAVMRVLLFLAALGVVAHGGILDPANPPASMFRLAAGPLGYRLFGLVMWSAAVTSVVGASYTSTSFLKTLHPLLHRERIVILSFIVIATLFFLAVGRPVKTLVVAGALNGLVLPLALGTILLAAHQRRVVGEYHHSVWLTIYGGAVVIAMSVLAVSTIFIALSQLS
ncbi:MAG TPA: NRAMP family divalent metal transporter [Longimicrobiales bacterium]